MTDSRVENLVNQEKVIVEFRTEAGNIVRELSATTRGSDTIKRLLNRYLLNSLKSASYETGNGNRIQYETFQIKNLLADSNGIKRLIVTCNSKDYPTPRRDQNDIGQVFRRVITFANQYGGYKIPIIIPFILACVWITLYHPKKDNQICFSETGCFSLDFPWNQRPPVFHFVPQSPIVINVTFTKMLSQYPSSRLVFDMFNFDSYEWHNEVRDVILIVHGYMDDSTSWMETLAEAFLSSRDVIIINVDWRRGARMYYPQVVANTRIVGKEIYRLIKTLKEKGVNAIDIIGHSLGAHIAGYAGKMNPTWVRRIIALDPAFPLFEGYHEDIRLSNTDAEQVMVIHSNVGPYGCGMRNPVGTVDVYLNNGQDQPGCTPMKSLLSQPLTIDRFSNMQDEIACSHRRAYEMFEEFIQSPESFVVYECPSLDHLLGNGQCETTNQIESHRLVDLFENVSLSKGEGHVYWMPT